MAKHTTLKSLFTSIADAIRSKTGDSSTIIADDFPDAISAIKTHEVEDSLLSGDNIITEYANNRINKIRPYTFCEYEIEKADFLNVRNIGEIGHGYSFSDCTSLETLNVPKLIVLGCSSFLGCHRLTEINCPKLILIFEHAFLNCWSLRNLDIGNATKEDWAFWTENDDIAAIHYEAFMSSNITNLIIRLVQGIFILSDVNAFENTPIARGEGYIYVPRALVEQYKAAENWSTFADQIRALEDYTIDGTITGEFNYSLT